MVKFIKFYRQLFKGGTEYMECVGEVNILYIISLTTIELTVNNIKYRRVLINEINADPYYITNDSYLNLVKGE